VEQRGVHASQLGYIPADEGTGLVEPLRLTQRVHHPVGPGVVAGSGHPLPVARIVGHIGVREQGAEVPVSLPPVDPQVAGKEGSGDHAGPVVHKAFGGQLPHPRVHDRNPGAPRPPRVQRIGILTPGLHTGPVVLRGDVRERGGDLIEEVTPGELPAELRAAWTVACADRHLKRRHAAEPQIRAQP
jgi:hypothetical protein